MAAGLRRRGRKHPAAGDGARLRQLLVRLLPRAAAHGRRAPRAGREQRARRHRRDRRARRTARAERVLRPRPRALHALSGGSFLPK